MRVDYGEVLPAEACSIIWIVRVKVLVLLAGLFREAAAVEPNGVCLG